MATMTLSDITFSNYTGKVALLITSGGTYTFSNCQWDESGTYEIEIGSGVTTPTTITLTNGSTALTTGDILNSGSSTFEIQNFVTVSVHVEDEGGNDLQSAQVYVQKASPTSFTSDAGNNAGDPDLIVNETVDTDIPQTGWLVVWDKSANEIMPYRYASWSTKTFTLRTEVTGSATSTGSGTSLISTSTNFLTEDYEEGDTIRNTTDGSWAVIDEIVDADNVTTSQLQGGSDNTWQSGDGFSIHKLAVSLVDNDDIVDIPLMNMQTDVSGDVSKNYNYSSNLAIKVRIRSQQGATKYQLYDTSGTITSSGYSLTAVLIEDEVA